MFSSEKGPYGKAEDGEVIVIAQDGSEVRCTSKLLDPLMTLGSLVGAAPKRRCRSTRLVEGTAGAVQGLESRTNKETVKSGKKASVAEVRGFRSPLSTCS